MTQTGQIQIKGKDILEKIKITQSAIKKKGKGKNGNGNFRVVEGGDRRSERTGG